MSEYIVVKIIITIFFGLILGFLSAIPVGAVQLVVIKKSLRGEMRLAVATAFGSATSDLIYGIITLFGFGNFLHIREIQILIYTAGICVLTVIIYKTIRESGDGSFNEQKYSGRKRMSFLTGFSIAITNPGIIVWWLVGYKLFMDLNFFQAINTPVKALFVISGCVGLGGYLVLIAGIVGKMKKLFRERFLYWANNILIVLLVAVVIYFIFKLFDIISGTELIS